MTTGRMRRAVDWAKYVAARSLMALMQALPWDAARAFARWLGRVAYVVDRAKRRRRARENVRRAFPQLSRSDARRLVIRSYEHFAEVVLDALNFGRFAGRGQCDRLLEPVGFEKLKGLGRDRGLIFVSGHFGQWEVLGAALPMLGYPVWSVARGFDNPRMARHSRRLRQRTGQRIVPKEGALVRVLRMLRHGECVGMLIDQDAGRDGVFVDFFGRPASTTASPARIALRDGIPVAFVYAQRVPHANRFRVVIEDVIDPASEPPGQDDVLRMTQRLTTDLEGLIRRAPAQWPWRHRRWRTYPGKYDAR